MNHCRARTNASCGTGFQPAPYPHAAIPARRTNTARRPTGFTLIELIVCIVTSAIIAGMAGALVWNACKDRTEVGARAELTDIAARALEQMLRYIREIGQDAGLSGLAQITTAASNDLRFGAYGFRANGTAIEMTTDTATSWWPVARDLSSLTFTYYDKNGTALTSLPLSATDRQAVRLIKINIQLARSTETAKLQTSIYLRSFMNEVISP